MLAYCVKCKTNRKMKKAKESFSSNGRHMVKGICPICGCKMCCFVKK